MFSIPKSSSTSSQHSIEISSPQQILPALAHQSSSSTTSPTARRRGGSNLIARSCASLVGKVIQPKPSAKYDEHQQDFQSGIAKLSYGSMWKMAKLCAGIVDTALVNRYKLDQLSDGQAELLFQAWAFEMAANVVEKLGFPKTNLLLQSTTVLLDPMVHFSAFTTRLVDHQMFSSAGFDIDHIASTGSHRVIGLVLATLWDCGIEVPFELMKTCFSTKHDDTAASFLKQTFCGNNTSLQVLSYQNLMKAYAVFNQEAAQLTATASFLPTSTRLPSPEGMPAGQARHFFNVHAKVLGPEKTMETIDQTFERLVEKNDPLLMKQAVPAYITLKSASHPHVVYPENISEACTLLLYRACRLGDYVAESIFQRLEARNRPGASGLHESILAWNRNQLTHMREHFNREVERQERECLPRLYSSSSALKILGLPNTVPFESELTMIECRIREGVVQPTGQHEMVAWHIQQARKLAACDLLREYGVVRIDQIDLGNAESFLQGKIATHPSFDALFTLYQSEHLSDEDNEWNHAQIDNAIYLREMLQRYAFPTNEDPTNYQSFFESRVQPHESFGQAIERLQREIQQGIRLRRPEWTEAMQARYLERLDTASRLFLSEFHRLRELPVKTQKEAFRILGLDGMPASVGDLQSAYRRQQTTFQSQPNPTCLQRELQRWNNAQLDEAFKLVHSAVSQITAELTSQNWYVFLDWSSDNEIRNKIAAIMTLPISRQEKAQKLASVLNQETLDKARRRALAHAHPDKRTDKEVAHAQFLRAQQAFEIGSALLKAASM